MPRDIDLLQAELDVLWVRDSRGRLLVSREPSRPLPLAVIAVAPDGTRVAPLASLPGDLARELEESASTAAPAVSGPPPAVLGAERILAAAGYPVVRESGPSYLIEPGTRWSSAAAILTSAGGPDDPSALLAPSEANWPDDEWRDLLAGALGPWAFALHDDGIVAICHAARLTPSAAEAGVWTHPAHRGRGHAPAVTAAWAALVHAAGREAFYSTSAENHASQRVAARLGLHPIGWLWKLLPPIPAIPPR